MKKLLFIFAVLLMANIAKANRVVTFNAETDGMSFVETVYSDDDGMPLYDLWKMEKDGVTVFLNIYEEETEPIEDNYYIIKFGSGIVLDVRSNQSEGGIKMVRLTGLMGAFVTLENLYLADGAYGDYYCIGNYGIYSCDDYTQSVQFYGGPAKISTIEVTLTGEDTPGPEPTELTAAPTFNGYTTDGIHAYFVEILPTEPSVIYYRVQYPDGTWTEWAEYEDILSFTGNGMYRVEAYAVADGKLPSYQIAYEFVVNPVTGLTEMVGNKTVASQRYFNAAGQEMSEANGLTIVVTTYTDGTTNTIKVVK